MKGPIARATVRTSGVLSLRLLIQAATLLLVARLLGPRDYGAFAGIAALAVMLGTLSTFGTHLVLLAEVSREPTRLDRVTVFSLPITLLTGAGLFVTYLIVGMLITDRERIGLDVIVLLGITELWLQPLLTLPGATLLGRGRIADSQLLITAPFALRLASVAIVFLLHPVAPLQAYTWGYLAASLIALGVVMWSMPGMWPDPRIWRLPHLLELKHSAGYGVLNLTANGPAELDKTLALSLLVPDVSGLYAAAARIIGAATLPVIAMMLSSLPRLFREGGKDNVRTGKLLRWTFSAATIYGICLAVILWAIAPVIEMIFGRHYHGITTALRWLCFVIPGMTLRITCGSILMSLGRPWMRVGFELAGLIVLIAASGILASRFGLKGMCVALACAEWTMALAGGILVYVARHQGYRDLSVPPAA